MSEVRVVNEQTHHREPNNGDERWKDNDGSAESLSVTERTHRESKERSDNGRWSAQELCITRRVTHPFYQNDGEEITNCIACGARTAEEESETPIVEITDVAPELIGGDLVVLGVGAISLDTIEHPFSLLLGEECIFVWEILDNYNKVSKMRGRMERKRRTEEGNDTGNNSDSSRDDEQPLPPIQTTLASELCNTTGNGRGETTDLYVFLV